MFDRKYIMVDGCKPILFGGYFSHKEIGFIAERYGKITSAGFFTVDGKVYGESEGLKLKSVETDTFFIQKVLKGD